jgi:hypothetical protein
MSNLRSLLALSTISLVLGATCVSCSDSDKAPASQKGAGAATLGFDAAPPAPAPTLPAAPLTGTHIDDHDDGYRPAAYQPARPSTLRGPQHKDIELVLRSSPPGAIASIDGRAIGNTPTFWHGAADGKPHEYTFTKKGYSMARYRFVSTQSGVVHGSLKALVVGSEAAANKNP